MTDGTQLRRRSRGVVPEVEPPLPRAQRTSAQRRWSRKRGVVGVFAGAAVLAFAAAYIGPAGLLLTDSAPAEASETTTLYASTLIDTQSFASEDTVVEGFSDRGGYEAYETPKPVETTSSSGSVASSSVSTPSFSAPDPGTAQSIAYGMVTARGWGDSDFACLVALWNRESGWNASAYNASSGAYGIPQALPGSKMASAGDDWATNAATQISWGLSYIAGRYGSPCGAWSHSESTGWY